jgi:hypothetical protein
LARFERPFHELSDLVAKSDVPIQKIPAGVRGPKAEKPGPKPKSGARYACGKLKPQKQRSEIAPALWARIKANAIRMGEDSRLGCELSRLSMMGELTLAQTAAGMRLAEIYGRFERSIGRRRSAASPAYAIGHGDPDLAEDRMTDEQIAQLAETRGRVRQAFLDLQEDLPVYPPRARALVEALCVEDRPLEPPALEEAKAVLDHLVRAFGPKWRDKKPGPGRPQRSRTAPAQVARVTVAPVGDTPAKIAHRMELRVLRPDLDDADIDRAYKLQTDLQSAIADRERFRRDKEIRKSATIPPVPTPETSQIAPQTGD